MKLAVEEILVRIALVTPEGRIDAFTVSSLRDRAESLLGDGVRHIVCDLSQTSFMDSAGLAALVSLMKRARQAGGDVRLVWPTSEATQRILQLTKFDRVFDRFADRDAAVASFTK